MLNVVNTEILKPLLSSQVWGGEVPQLGLESLFYVKAVVLDLGQTL